MQTTLEIRDTRPTPSTEAEAVKALLHEAYRRLDLLVQRGEAETCSTDYVQALRGRDLAWKAEEVAAALEGAMNMLDKLCEAARRVR